MVAGALAQVSHTTTNTVSGASAFPAGAPKPFAFNAFIGTASQGGSGTQGFSLLANGASARTTAVANAMQKGVAGISYTFFWSTLNPASGVYNWAPVYAALVDMAAYPGAQAILRVNGGPNTPGWLLSQVSTVVDAKGVTVPVPWDSTFLTNLKTFISAFGAQFNGNPGIYQVVIDAGGKVGEMSLDTAVNTLSTTVSGTYTAGTGTMNVASTTGFPNTGSVIVVGVGTVAYTGTSGGNQFTGCSGGTGTSAANAVVESPTSYQAIWSNVAANSSLAFNTTAGGYSDSLYATGAVGTSVWPTCIDQYHKAFPGTRLSLGLDEPFGSSFSNPDPPGGATACVPAIMTLGDTGGTYAQVFAIQQNGLDEGDLGKQPTGRFRRQIRRARYGESGMLGCGYQFVKAEGSLQNLRDGITVAVQDGVDYMEIYTADLISFPQAIQLLSTFTNLQPSQVTASQLLLAPDQSSPLTGKSLSQRFFGPTSGSPALVSAVTNTVTVAANGNMTATFASHSFSPDQTVIGSGFSGALTSLNGLEYLILTCTETTIFAEPVTTAASAGTDATGGTITFSAHLYDTWADTGFFWMQTVAGPTNSPAYVAVGPKLATAYANPSAPGATSSQTLVMAGFAIAFTPLVSGNVAVVIAGQGQTATAVTGFNVAGRYGTGTAPIAGAAVTGTAFPQGTLGIRPAVVSANAAWTLVGAITGLTVGTAYWFDVAYSTNTAADAATISGISAVLMERQ